MRKRHLEILGYHVLQVRKKGVVPLLYLVTKTDRLMDRSRLQIPHFEWNSMELSTPDAWKEYLRNKLFTELHSVI